MSNGLANSLRLVGLKATAPRLLILKTLHEKHGPYTADELFGLLKKQGIDRVTVYRSLDGFEKAGLVRRCTFGAGPARYEFQDEHHHHHVICRDCKKIISLPDCEIAAIDKRIEKLGFSNVSHSLEFFATCPACQ